MNRQIVWVLILFVLSVSSQAAIVGKEVEYKAGGTLMKGYLAYDDAIGKKRPGILVVHEWWGHNEYSRRRAKMLAELGYTALAVDMYGDGKQAEHPKDAGSFSKAVGGNIQLAKARFKAAMRELNQHPTVDRKKTAAIGYCFGGAIVLQMARQGLDLDGVVSFHGSLTTKDPAKKGQVKAAVLVHNGADDPFVKPEQIVAFEKEMQAAGVDYTLIQHANAKHSFTSPDADTYGKKFNIPLAYNAEADKASWKSMQDFFKKIFAVK